MAPPAGNYRPAVHDLSFPQTDAVVEVKRGEVMLAKGYSKEIQGVSFAEPVKLDQFTLQPGFYPRIGDDADFTYYSFRTTPTSQGVGYIPPARDPLGDWLPAPDALRIAKADGMTCLIFVGWRQKACNSKARHEIMAKQELGPSDLVQKLIYEGRSGGTISVRYWETSGHSSRPESSQKLTYALPASDIEYRGARIRVIEADANKVRFVAKRNFTEYWVGTKTHEGASPLTPVSASEAH